MVLADVGLAELILTAGWLFFLFMFVWLFVSIVADLFRDRETSGWGKAGWILLLVVMPLLGSLIYLIARGRSMTERTVAAQMQTKAEVDQYVRETAGTAASPSQEISRLVDLRQTGVISETEFERLKERVLVDSR